MPDITADILVDIVSELTLRLSTPLVAAKEILDYCKTTDIRVEDNNGRRNYDLLEAADNVEAASQHRLQKFKRGSRQQARVAWALFAYLDAANQWADENGWLLVPWERESSRWAREAAGPPLTTPEFI